MKTISIIFAFAISFTAYSQNWELVSSNTTDEIKDMYFKDETIGFAVATQGKILKTIDGGLNWNLIYQNNELFHEQCIVATNENVYCFAENFNGEVKKLEFQINLNDFQISTFNTSMPINELITFNNTIYVSGSKYENGQFIPLQSDTTISGSAISNGSSDFYKFENNLTASDGHHIFTSSDGITWSLHQFHAPFLTSGPFHSFYDGVNKMRTVTNYPCVVHISDDNGLNWSFNQINIQSLYFYFLNAENVLGLNLFEAENKIYYSTNSGVTFSFDTVPNPVEKLYNLNEHIVFAYGENGIIYKSTNGGGLLNVKDLKKKNPILVVYPNPSLNEINIEYDPTYLKINSISLLDVNGRIINEFYSNSTKLNLQNLQVGTYFLNFDTGNGIITKQIIRK